MSRLTRDGTAEPVSRDQILRHARGQGNVHFPCSADHEQDWQPYPVDPYSAICDDHTYIHSFIYTNVHKIAGKPHAGKSIYQQYLLLCISVATSTYEGERNKKKRLGGWVRTATAAGIQQADCHQISHLSAHILYLVAVRNQYAECEKQQNNHATAVHRPRQHTRRATKIYCIQYFSARSIFNCSRGGYLAVMYLLGWGGVIFLCSVSHPEKSGNFCLSGQFCQGQSNFTGTEVKLCGP